MKTAITPEDLLLAMEGIPDDLLERSEGEQTASRGVRRRRAALRRRYILPVAAALCLLLLAGGLRTLRMGSTGTDSGMVAFEEAAAEPKEAAAEEAPEEVSAAGAAENTMDSADTAGDFGSIDYAAADKEEETAAAEAAGAGETEESAAEKLKEAVRKLREAVRRLVRKAAGRNADE